MEYHVELASERQRSEPQTDLHARNWARRRPGWPDTEPLLLHWVDEKGAVVRLISSSSTQREQRDSAEREHDPDEL